MTQGSIWQQILLFAIPIMLSNIVSQLYNAADSVVVGKYIGYTALAAVGANNSIINVIINLFLGFGAGAGVIVSQYLGANDIISIKKTVHSGIIISLISGVIITVLGYAFAKPMLQLINTPVDVIDMSAEYLRIYFIGVTSVIFYNMGAGVLRASGDSLAPFLYLLVCSIINFVMDIIFVKYLNMGIAGAAWATIITQTIASILVLMQLLLTKGVCRLSYKYFKIDKTAVGKIFKIGLPIGLQTSMYSVANLLIQANLNSFGSLVMASWVAANKVDNFTYAPVGAYGAAVNTFVGQNFGARKFDRVKKGTYQMLLISQITVVIMAVPVFIFASKIITLFNDDPTVIATGANIIRLILPFYTFFGVCEVLSATLKGVGRTTTSAIISFIGILVIRAIWLYVVVYFFHTQMVLFFVHPVSWIVTAGLFIIYFLVKKWNGVFNYNSLPPIVVNDPKAEEIPIPPIK